MLTASICMLTFISFETNTGQNQSVLRQELKIVRMLIVVRAFCFCWVPQGSWDLLNLHHPNFTDENNWSLIGISLYIQFTCFPPSTNSLYSPIIYACLDQTYREAFKHLFRKIMCRTRKN